MNYNLECEICGEWYEHSKEAVEVTISGNSGRRRVIVFVSVVLYKNLIAVDTCPKCYYKVLRNAGLRRVRAGGVAKSK